MIYVMIYTDRHGKLAGIRYDTNTRLYAASGAIVPDGYMARPEYPQADQVLLAHEVSAEEQQKENLGAITTIGGKQPAMWLKTMGTFKSAPIQNPNSTHAHAYELMDYLIHSNAIPAFFDHLLSSLKDNDIILENGERNPEVEVEQALLTPFSNGGPIDRRHLN